MLNFQGVDIGKGNKKIILSKKSPTGPTERTPKPEYPIALVTSLGVRWQGPIQFLMDIAYCDTLAFRGKIQHLQPHPLGVLTKSREYDKQTGCFQIGLGLEDRYTNEKFKLFEAKSRRWTPSSSNPSKPPMGPWGSNNVSLPGCNHL